MSSLHNHLLIYSDVDYYKVESKIFNYWKNIGSLRIEKYNRDLNYNKFFSEGSGIVETQEDYNSHNTKRLKENELIELLKTLGY